MRQTDFKLRTVALEAFGPTIVNSIGHGAVLPVLALQARHLGAGVDLAALVVALLSIGQLVTSLPAGAIMARIGERRMLICCGLVDCVAMLVAWRATSVLVLGAAIVLSGATWTGFLLARQGFLIEAVPPTHRARAMSSLGASHRVGLFVGPLIGAGIIAWQGLSAVFVLAAVMSLTSAVMARLMRDLGHESRADQKAAGHASVVSVLAAHRHTLLTLGVGVVVIGASRSIRGTLLPLWADHIGMSGSETSLVFAVAAAVDILFFFPGGWLMDHKGRAVVAVPVVLAVAIGSLLLPLATNEAALLAVAVLIAMGNGLGSGIVMTIGADTAPVLGRSQYLGGWRLCGDIGGTTGPLLVSAVASVAPLATASVVFGVATLAGTGWVGHWTRQLDRRRADAGARERAQP
ncbi:MFS transporter [Nocardioides sp. JQ2195]|uniref:MFS transporter n=1 Tax=Nocardioides sp. JQ2195 TaxID=2592334 RepID=UPI00143E2184|nr:MFS transporter [Nocardioides sp. JQ2195]QIX25381.1 MFS transporter [Nocardioides sp. JQ2195]